ncbi:FecR family protein [Candidatus Thiothrix sp. Deng01]|uniref:FecR family protein n=1 Tax=Candidatus Thiothrix phosphatis TaxID=3112415 RepID=A0ABU6D058_9GAMM|nr:FecR family protein [Candidatus Thiothrix sp. Deng01]MEB4592465.1 FecR family protein [Candidatus Thiothrix sp. Deng01]
MQLIRAIVFIFLVMFGALAMAQPNAPDQPIGKVLFSTGDAYADQIKLQAGSPIYIGQTLSTGNVGHLHIRMIDGAFLSLRPTSSAKVALYTVDLDDPANTKIRIDVQHGVVRSVTGKGGEENHSAFRLNTPVAAIGIRGTDFIVYTDAISSVVDLRQGGIAMTPLSDTCSPYTLGICNDGQAVTLADRDPGLLAEVSAARQKATRVSKASAAIVPDKIEPAHPAEDQSLKQAKETPVVISAAPAAEVKTSGTTTSDTASGQTTDGKKDASSTDTKTAATTTSSDTSKTSTGSTTASNTSTSGSGSTGESKSTAATTTGTTTNESKTTGTTASTGSTVASDSRTTAGTVVTGSTYSTTSSPTASNATTTVTTTGGTTVTFVTPSTSTASAGSAVSATNVATSSAGATVDVASIAPVTAEVGAKESVTSELASRVITQAATDSTLKEVEKAAGETAPTVPVVSTPPVEAKAQPFYWGRWSDYVEKGNVEQTIQYLNSKGRQIGGNQVMILASTEKAAPVLPKTGEISFKLDKAEAHVLTGKVLQDASVSNPALTVNFDQNSFKTSLDVSSSALANGTEHLKANGTLNPNTGMLREGIVDTNMTVYGEVADGASHAGYLFNQESTGIVGAASFVK